uniref:acyl-CoA-binding domain-containing protein 6-like isoform X1 n=2 Tax=Myxine glutinosa TaxID=7769 RepID=UPI00358FA505
MDKATDKLSSASGHDTQTCQASSLDASAAISRAENTTYGPVMSTMYHQEEISEEEKTPFDRCQDGDVQWLQRELKTGSVSPELADSEGRTLLHWACDRGQTSTAVMLLQNGALPNCQDNEGLTPLHYACAAGDPVLVSRLLESGADPNVVDNDGLRPSQTTDCPTLRHLLQ